MSVDIPEQAQVFGFVGGTGGTHSSRTIMVSELRALLNSCPTDAHFKTYQSAIVEQNVLLKATQATRLGCLRALRELYALNPNTLLFRALRDLWEASIEAQPLLALMCAVARDPLLRSTAALIAETLAGTPITAQMLAEAANTYLAGRYKPTVLAVIGRNTASSWQQAGHLSGRTNKIRTTVTSSPPAVAYALLLGYLCGARGDLLFDTLWARLLDARPHLLREHAIRAAQLGWLEYRHAGTVTDISFHYLLRDGAERVQL